MSLSTYTDVWCDVCGNWEQNATSKRGSEARRIARRLGWRVGIPGGLDVCPVCIAQGKSPTRALGEEEPLDLRSSGGGKGAQTDE